MFKKHILLIQISWAADVLKRMYERDKTCSASSTVSVTRLGNLLNFGQLFNACGNNHFAQITHILGNFCEGVKIFHFSSEIIIGQLL